MLNFAAITPHPPIIIPGVGASYDRLQAKQTIAALKELASELIKIQPDTIIIISPHAQMQPDVFVINSNESLEGGFDEFGFSRACSYPNDLEFINQLQDGCNQSRIPAALAPLPLDHGALVPLYYLLENLKSQVVHLAYSLLPSSVHIRYGRLIGEMARASSKKIAIIASGDLSHRLSAASPHGFSPEGAVFDRTLIENLQTGDASLVAQMEEVPDLLEGAGECGYRSVVMLMGALDGVDHNFKLLSYESPFGVGYLTARLV